ncbi:UNVERIFIED_CONTAM: hypothetical protein GTU68_007715 [Idotea baltica]|nr:hypothetical protein [Idotea baltica]
MVLTAYQFGIFPWYDEDSRVLWWFTHPRFVLFPEELHVSKSMRNVLNQNLFTVTYNRSFTEVMEACGSINRPGQSGTWIHESMKQVYGQLHDIGVAQSVEVYQSDQLVGGLYGIRLGNMFFGESMFARVSNASKVGFIFLVRRLRADGVVLIDCQQETRHLGSLGARLIDREDFYEFIRRNWREIFKKDKDHS